jgi:hypothetical protein
MILRIAFKHRMNDTWKGPQQINVASRKGQHGLAKGTGGIRKRNDVHACTAESLPEMIDIPIAEYLKILRLDEVSETHHVCQ